MKGKGRVRREGEKGEVRGRRKRGVGWREE